jgi:hypothetical protein
MLRSSLSGRAIRFRAYKIARFGGCPLCRNLLRVTDPLNATIEEFAAQGYTHVECYCPRCRVTRLKPISWLAPDGLPCHPSISECICFSR